MKGLADYIQATGLKAGLYTSPGPKTCGGFTAACQHEAQDAQQFAAWGFDFLKYDWCSYGHIAPDGSASDKKIARWGKGAPTLQAHKKPSILMGDLLKQQNRDIVFNLCQYGWADLWKGGKDIGGHSWRTSGDLGFQFHRIVDIAPKNSQIGEFNGPGGWNDPDYIQIGWIGSTRSMGQPKPCPLTPNEQSSFPPCVRNVAKP